MKEYQFKDFTAKKISHNKRSGDMMYTLKHPNITGIIYLPINEHEVDKAWTREQGLKNMMTQKYGIQFMDKMVKSK
jgi:hypothetical protein